MIENVPVRIARPLNSKGKLPAVVYFHGGAYYMGSLGECDLSLFYP
jgi:acetyl esterase/lipase